MTASAIAGAVGIAGTAAVLGAYLLLMAGKLARTGWAFLLLNLFGSAGIVCSLAFAFNLPAMLIEASWCAISLFAIARRLRLRGGAS